MFPQMAHVLKKIGGKKYQKLMRVLNVIWGRVPLKTLFTLHHSTILWLNHVIIYIVTIKQETSFWIKKLNLIKSKKL